MKAKHLIKIGILVLVVSAFALFFGLGLHSELTFENLTQLKQALQSFKHENIYLSLAWYFTAYILLAAFSLPGAAAMTLVGGAIFGFWPALLTISFSSTLGATMACFFSRYVLGDWVQEKFADKIEPINQGMRQDGLVYLFAMRLVPLFPFFVINLVMGLTRIRLFSFYWVSQIGMLPGTAVFVNAGAQLGNIESINDILSPTVLASFAALGIFPLVAKWLLERLRAKRRRST